MICVYFYFHLFEIIIDVFFYLIFARVKITITFLSNCKNCKNVNNDPILYWATS